MDKGLTVDCAALWAFIRKDGGWWSVLRLTRHWTPTYSLGEVEEILATLHKVTSWSARRCIGQAPSWRSPPNAFRCRGPPRAPPQLTQRPPWLPRAPMRCAVLLFHHQCPPPGQAHWITPTAPA